MINKFKLQAVSNWAVVIFVVVFGLIYFKKFIQPFVLASVIWYLIRAARNWLGKLNYQGKTLPRWFQLGVSFILTFGTLWLFFEIIVYNVNLITEKSSEYNDNLKLFLESLVTFTDIVDLNTVLSDRFSYFDFETVVRSVINSISSALGDITLIFIYVIFLLIEEGFLPKKIEIILNGSSKKEQILGIISQISKSINTYFTVKTSMSLLTGILSYLVMTLLGVDFAVLWAFLIFLFNYIPYVGSLIATLLPSIFAIFQFGSFLPFLWVFISIESVQLLVGNYIEPRIMGKNLNLSPLAVILSLVFWGAIWGIIGMILSVPIISVAVIIMGYFPATHKIAILLTEKGELKTHTQV